MLFSILNSCLNTRKGLDRQKFDAGLGKSSLEEMHRDPPKPVSAKYFLGTPE
jgi:hypothetical protein